MRTISFYSYKGGVGRTLLVAHVARYLAAMGHNVVVADLDFDAPGLPAIFGLNAFKDVRAGMLELVSAFSGRNQMESQWHRQIQRCLIQPARRVVRFRKDKHGWLRILPSGNAGAAKYWRTVCSASWHSLLSSEQGRNPIVKFVNHVLKPTIETMGADYLLIDSRAGVTHYGGIGKLIADREVMIFSTNDEARHVLAHLSAGLQLLQERRIHENKERSRLNLPSEQDPKLVFTLVVSRIPPELAEARKTLRSWQIWLKRRFSNIVGFNGILPLHNDLHTHIDQQLRFPREGAPGAVVQFHVDVTRIIAQICPEAIPESERGKPLGTQASMLFGRVFGRAPGVTQVNRLFGLLDDRGEMLNLDDGTRNVAFKVDTFLRFLNNFYDEFEREFHKQLPGKLDAKTLRKKVGEFHQRIVWTLAHAGHQCGEAFGRSLASELRASGEFESDGDRIREWCRFDTRAGFGRLDFHPPDKLRVKNLFLWKPKMTGRRDFTAFFSGYAESVLRELLRSKVRLELLGNPSTRMLYKISKIS